MELALPGSNIVLSTVVRASPVEATLARGGKGMAKVLFGQIICSARFLRPHLPARRSMCACPAQQPVVGKVTRIHNEFKTTMGRVLPRGRGIFFFYLVGMTFLSSPLLAFDGASSNTDDSKKPLQIFKDPQSALRAGLAGARSGDGHWIDALKYAAAGGESLAQWKLGKMYASGDGVPHDDVKAYDYFSQIVASYDDESPNWRIMPLVANAYVALGIYYLNGIANTKIKPDPRHAMAMFQYAAINFGDSNAQYNLARLYLDGSGTSKDSRQAVRWLSLAADKNHYYAQALLGQILFTGKEGIQPQRARGLMWLTLAREAPLDTHKDFWIIDLYDKAMASASADERQEALAYLENFLKK